MEQLPSWLGNEAISNYVVFALGIVVGIVAWIIRARLERKKPSIIEVARLSEESLISIKDKDSVQGNLRITYQGSEVASLYRTEFRIANIGAEPLSNLAVTIIATMANSDDFLEVSSDPPASTRSEDNGGAQAVHATLTFPYLNPAKEFKTANTVHFYTRSPISQVQVQGSGFGWSTLYADKLRYWRLEFPVTDSLIDWVAFSAGLLGEYYDAKYPRRRMFR